jgi:hypothetical protein
MCEPKHFFIGEETSQCCKHGLGADRLSSRKVGAAGEVHRRGGAAAAPRNHWKMIVARGKKKKSFTTWIFFILFI